MPGKGGDDHTRSFIMDDVTQEELKTQEGQERVAIYIEHALLTRRDLTPFDLEVIASLKDVMKLKKEWSAMKLVNDMLKLKATVDELLKEKRGHA